MSGSSDQITNAVRNMAAEQFPTIDVADTKDQEGRIEDIQFALYHAQTIMDGIHYDRIAMDEIRAISYFAGRTLEYLANGVAEDAVKFAMQQTRNLESDLAKAPSQKGNIK